MKKNKYPSAATQINRNFYTRLRKLGRSYPYIMDIIKPERRAQFRIDILPLLEAEHTKPSLCERIKNYFKTGDIISYPKKLS